MPAWLVWVFVVLLAFVALNKRLWDWYYKRVGWTPDESESGDRWKR